MRARSGAVVGEIRWLVLVGAAQLGTLTLGTLLLAWRSLELGYPLWYDRLLPVLPRLGACHSLAPVWVAAPIAEATAELTSEHVLFAVVKLQILKRG